MSFRSFPSPLLHRHGDLISPTTTARSKWQIAIGGSEASTEKKWHATIDGALQVADIADRRISSLSKVKGFLELSQSANLSLAELLRSRGDFDRALPIYEACFEERKRYLGCDHPHTLLLEIAVAFTLHLKGEHARALPLFDRCLSAWIDAHGEEHANTALYRSRRDACAARLSPASPPLPPSPHAKYAPK